MANKINRFSSALRSPTLVKYILSGFILNGLGYALFVYFISITSETVFSVLLASCCLFPISFLMNKYYVYQSVTNKKDRIDQLKKFALIYVVFGVSNVAIVYVAIKLINANHLLIQFAVLAALIAVNFCINFFWIFKPKKSSFFGKDDISRSNI